MADRKLKTWAEIKTQRPLSLEAQAANAAWVEQQITELTEANEAGQREIAEPRKPGRLKDRIRVGSDFDDPLPDEILAPFRGERE